jgi:flavin-binding protein dodecin
MGKILCATRGGEAAIKNQEAAIERAREQADELVFFYVVDVEFMASAHYAVRSDVVTEEMVQMADFLMAMAVERAEKRDVDASYVIRHGNFADELKATVDEAGITLVILGRPGEEESAFRLAGLEQFAASLKEETGVEVWIPGLDEAQ